MATHRRTGAEGTGRTHEPSLREVTAELDGLRELMLAKIQTLRTLMNERDRLYRERDRAAKQQTLSSFLASEKAIAKAEEAQHSYNQTHNELSKKLDEQNKATMPRIEIEQRFGAMDAKVAELRDMSGERRGQQQGVAIVWAVMVAVVTLAIAVIALFRH